MDAEQLRQTLFAAIAKGDVQRFGALCGEHADAICENFHSWLRVPESVRSDPAGVQQWVDAVMVIARHFADAGFPDLLQAVAGEGDDNPINRWRDGLSQAQQLTGSGAARESNEILLAIRAEMEGASGEVIDDLRPKVLGSLATNWFEMGDFGQALEFATLALQECRHTGDQAGIRTYLENLQVIWAVHLPTIDPEEGQRLLDCRDSIVKAQKLSDDAKYERSNAVLLELLSKTGNLADCQLTGYQGKVCGLAGFNFFRLRDFAEAVRWTEHATERAYRAGDVTGVRIYQENLGVIRKAQADPGITSSSR